MKKILLIICVTFFILASFQKVIAQNDWSKLTYPTLKYVDEDRVSKGAVIFNRLIVNQDSIFKSRILAVCRILYHNSSEVAPKTVFIFSLRNTSGVAATGGDSGKIDMFLNSQYVESFYNNNGSNDQKTYDEICGIFTHELTHAYQNSPSDAGGYSDGTEHFSCIEGVADVVRTKAGLNAFSFRRSGGNWCDGYKTTAFFLDWLSAKDPDFVYKFNQSVSTIKQWSWNKATIQLMGKPVSELWDEYQKYLNPIGNNPVAGFSSDKKAGVTYESVSFKDLSSSAPYQWHWRFEGGIPSYSDVKNPVVVYNTTGTYKVELSVKSPYGKDSIAKANYITISQNPNGELITGLTGVYTTQYNDSPENEEVKYAFDNKKHTKFLTFHNSSWIQFECKKKYAVKKYMLTSANDADERDPKDFILKGSNNGKDWKVIDSQKNISFESRYKTMEFTPLKSDKFSQFRLEMVNHSGNTLQLGDLKIFGVDK